MSKSFAPVEFGEDMRKARKRASMTLAHLPRRFPKAEGFGSRQRHCTTLRPVATKRLQRENQCGLLQEL
jgi:hypothetical protein